MNGALARILWGVAGLAVQGCGAAVATAPAPVVVASPPIGVEQREPETVAEPAPQPAGGEVASATEGDETASEVSPVETEACIEACIAASAERRRALEDDFAHERRQCPTAPVAARRKCLTAVDENEAQAQYSEDGGQHACRTNCPGYLNQF